MNWKRVPVFFLVISGLSLIPAGRLMAEGLEKSPYHIFLDYDFAVTMEVVEDGDMVTPILNIIAFSGGTWELSPPDLKVLNDDGVYASEFKFSIDTGGGSKPYITPYLQISGGDHFGFDLVGDLKDYKEPKLVSIRFGREWFTLEPVSLEEFEAVLGSLKFLDIRDPDLISSFEELDLRLMGSRGVTDD